MTTAAERTVDYLIIGGGLAAATAAEAIRKQDQQGSITIVSNEDVIPYHRPPLSKEYVRGEIGVEGTYGEGGVYVQMPDWYQEQHIELLQQTEGNTLNTRARTVTLNTGQTLQFKTLLLATGGRPRQLSVPGAKLPDVFLLRTLKDANAIREQLSEGKRIVVVGSGFIGMEVAASALTKGARVTIVEPQARIWPDTISPELSAYFQRQFEKRGATLRYGYSATEFIADQDGRLAAVRISEGSSSSLTEDIPCDIALIGIGIQLNTELAQHAGLEVDPRNGIVVDEHLETQVEDIFAAGDVAAYPDPIVGRMHFEHWDNALSSGQTAATNMLGHDEPYRHIPYFFSDQFNLSINMLGYPSSEAQIVIRGDMNANTFTAFYIQDTALRAALMVNDDAQMDLVRDLIAASVPVTQPQQLASPSFDLSTLQPA
jgi:3-phenylpropionate/trans-cinnamate dioxygenase ferredoxin reductase subunit